MKRYSITASAAVVFAVMIPMFTIDQSHVHSQDVTITIQKSPDTGRQDGSKAFDGNRPAVDVAILLDTSNSMDGLISQAKSQLWKIVQQFADAEKAGKTPQLRVSVFEYGNAGLPASEGYIRQVSQLTDDLDVVSESLFGLKTNGGDEYCGAVIDEALKRLDWSAEPNSYKAIFIAGNEPFTQGSVDYQKSCRKAIEAGVVVNTIHCGEYQAGVSGKWQHGAALAEGEYMNINQDRAVVHIPAPQDKIIIELNQKLNKTYLWFGAKNAREAYKSNQVRQDRNATQAASGITRFSTKAGKLYGNVGRDLIDSAKKDKEILEKLDVKSLPEEMQKMNVAERKSHLAKLSTKRDELKKKIIQVSAEREKYLAKIRSQQAAQDKDTLGDAVINAVRKQLKQSGFKHKKN